MYIKARPGPKMVREMMGVDYHETKWHKIFRAKNQYTGPAWRWLGISRLFWGKFVAIHAGERLIAGIPVTYFEGDIAKGFSLGDMHNVFTKMSQEEIVKAGGFWCLLRAGSALVAPPGHMLMEVNRGGMSQDDDTTDEDMATCAVDVLVSRTEIVPSNCNSLWVRFKFKLRHSLY